jgi:glycosyltransferase involved in cell wall biosynthesis
MRILFDHQAFTEQRYGGVSRYFTELISRLQKDPGFDCRLSFRYSNNEHLPEARSLPVKRFLGRVKFKGQYSLLKFVNKRFSTKVLSRGGFDLFHPTYFDPYFLVPLRDKPFVITVFDMIAEKYSKRYFHGADISSAKKAVISRADHVIAISRSTRDDLLEYYPLPEEKVTVIPLACPLSEAVIHQIPEETSSTWPKPYLLFVGFRGVYKNFDLFFEAVGGLLRDKDLFLVCAGGGAFNSREKALIERLRLSGRVFQTSFDDRRLARLYKNALAFVFPSLYEGFGLPILEAFACGCPVVLSRSSSFPEVAGEAGAYFDPSDRDSIRLAVEAVIEDEELREKIIKKGYEQLSKFTWEKTVEMTKAVYQKALSPPRAWDS